MRNLFITTMLVVPFAASTAFAQDATGQGADDGMDNAAEIETQGGAQTETPPETMGGGEQPEMDDAEASGPAPEAVVREQAQNEIRVDWITGTDVRSPDGESIGNINDLILDGETGEMTAAVLSVGGFLGIGGKQIAVDWSELQIDYDANEITLNLTREEADAAPEYVFREQEQPPAPQPADTGAGGTGMDTGTGMGTGTAGDPGTGGNTGTGGVQ